MKHSRSHDRQKPAVAKKESETTGRSCRGPKQASRPGEARTKVKAETTAKIAAWIVPRVREALR